MPRIPKGVRLAVNVDAPAPVTRNHPRIAKVRVQNTGGSTAKKVVLRFGGARGVSATPRRVRIGTLKSSAAKTVKVVLRPGRRARAKSTLTFTASTGKLRATAKTALLLKSTGKRKPVAQIPTTPPLAGRYYAKIRVDVMFGNSTDAYLFVDGSWAYRGVPEGGIPQCTAKTAGVDKDGDPTDGCIPYTYDPKTGAVTLDGAPATLAGDRNALTVGEDQFSYYPWVPTGTRLDAELRGVSVFGYWPNQIVSTTYLRFFPDGQYVRSGVTTSSLGGGANAGGSDLAVVPADRKGVYEFLPTGALRLTQADGTVDLRTAAIMRDSKTGSANPTTDGVLLDETMYFIPNE
ncbi:MAG: hypothetical protein JHC95_22835 [Solirubrobacteraceae bacterium]|nr:hypothetical protein [Solirubrobacteraceae bacterium]